MRSRQLFWQMVFIVGVLTGPAWADEILGPPADPAVEAAGLAVTLGQVDSIPQPRPFWTWVHYPALELIRPPGAYRPAIEAVSNVAFTPTTPSYPSFVYSLVIDTETAIVHELYLARYDGRGWGYTLLDVSTGTEDLPFHAEDYNMVQWGDRNQFNISIAYESDGSLGLAINGQAGASIPPRLLYLNVTPDCGCQCVGDVNGDGLIDGLDIQAFVTCALGNPTTYDCRCADIDGDGDIDSADQSLLVEMLLNGATCPPATPCTDWSRVKTTRTIASPAPAGGHSEFKSARLHIAPDGSPWIAFLHGYGTGSQDHVPGFAWRWNGEWHSRVGSGITGYEAALDAHDLYHDHVTNSEVGVFVNSGTWYLPRLAFRASFWSPCWVGAALGYMQLVPDGEDSVAVNSFEIQTASWCPAGGDGAFLWTMDMSQSGVVIYDRQYTDGATWYEQVMRLSGGGTSNAWLYETERQIVDDGSRGPAYLYWDKSLGWSTGRVKVHWGGAGDAILCTYGDNGYTLRNLSITRGPTAAPWPYKEVPVVIMWHQHDDEDGYTHFIAELAVPQNRIIAVPAPVEEAQLEAEEAP